MSKLLVCRVFRISIALLFAWMLSGCQMVMFDPAGVIAIEQKTLMLISIGLMLTVVVPVIIMTLVFSWKYRASNRTAHYTPNWDHNYWLEFVWWLIPCLIILILAILTWISSHTLDPYRPIEADKKPLQVEVVSLDWKWLFIYPEQNIATVNELHLPVDRTIAFKITSDAPMNSFWIPQLGSQIMSMPGMQTQLHMKGIREGIFKGYSANLSGQGFSNMYFNVHVSSDKKFDNWVKKVKKSVQKLTDYNYKILAQPDENYQINRYSSVTNNLFSKIMMKYMAPIADK